MPFLGQVLAGRNRAAVQDITSCRPCAFARARVMVRFDLSVAAVYDRRVWIQ
jgi:hypothetical protein